MQHKCTIQSTTYALFHFFFHSPSHTHPYTKTSVHTFIPHSLPPSRSSILNLVFIFLSSSRKSRGLCLQKEHKSKNLPMTMMTHFAFFCVFHHIVRGHLVLSNWKRPRKAVVLRKWWVGGLNKQIRTTGTIYKAHPFVECCLTQSERLNEELNPHKQLDCWTEE